MPHRYLVISEKLEEIKSFRELTCLDLSCCKLGDEHELLEHLTNEALSRYCHHLQMNCFIFFKGWSGLAGWLSWSVVPGTQICRQGT